MVMPVSRRLELLKWAEDADGFIIEDDYDGEYRYKGKPIPSLQGLDKNDRVIYLGTFSKSLIPSIRISYLVLPRPLINKYHQHFTLYKQTVSRLHQDTLFRFMSQAHWERHLNKMRTLYRKKQTVLLASIENYMGSKVTIIGERAGLHILIKVDNGMSEKELVITALTKGIKVYPVSIYYNNATNAPNSLILLGFGGLTIGEIEEGIRELKKAWNM
jgi:GntR family transcriptional regulator/MocR family aminotransferase